MEEGFFHGRMFQRVLKGGDWSTDKGSPFPMWECDHLHWESVREKGFGVSVSSDFFLSWHFPWVVAVPFPTRNPSPILQGSLTLCSTPLLKKGGGDLCC